jgi:hypothetical protein
VNHLSTVDVVVFSLLYLYFILIIRILDFKEMPIDLILWNNVNKHVCQIKWLIFDVIYTSAYSFFVLILSIIFEICQSGYVLIVQI